MTEWYQHQTRGDLAQHTTADALTEREFESLYDGALSISDDYQGQQARLLVLVTGRLGLRLGEVVHLREAWIDWEKDRTEIPGHQSCDQGIDGTTCAYCWDRIAYIVDDYGKDRATIAENWWRPKTRACIRGVPFGWSPRAEIVLTRFFDRFDQFFLSTSGVSRRLKKAASVAPDLDSDRIYPGSLRATAAGYQAACGLNPIALQHLMGWINIGSAESHIAQSDEHTQRSLRDVHSV